MRFFKLTILLILVSSSIWAVPKISISQKTLKQGATLKVTFLDKEISRHAHIKSQGKKIIFTPISKYKKIAYIGISRYQKLGELPLKIIWEDSNKKIHTKIIQLHIVNGNFKKTEINLPPKKKTLAKDKPKLTNESLILAPLFKAHTPNKHFKGPFIWPATGDVSSEFGDYRIYNGVSQSSRHSGIDIADDTGTKVIAPADGVVIYSNTLSSHGNTIMIDHGIGIISVYLHMEKRLKKTGDIVKKGSVIGLIGETGIATGPHLHFGMSVQNTRVNPRQWLKKNSGLF